METTATKLKTILLVGILSISMISAGMGSVGAAPAHSSIGSVSVDDRSAAGSTPAPPADPDEWDLRSAKHSETMSAEIIIDEETVRGITITDDVNHEGRDVSIAKDALSGWIEEIPDQVSGVHEDGSRWSSEVRISGDRVTVHVPEFSTQTITFSSRVSIRADPADDGASFEYEVANASSVANSELTLTGSDATQSEQRSYQQLSDGATRNLSIGGSTGSDLTVNISAGADPGSLTDNVSINSGRPTNPILDDGIIYVGIDNTLYAIHRDNETIKWSQNFGESVYAISEDNNNLYVSSREAVSAIDKTDGSEIWTNTNPSIVIDPVYVGSDDLLATDSSSNIFAIEKDNGSEIWSQSTNGDPGSLAVGNATVYTSTDNKIAYAIDRQFGSEKWSIDTTTLSGTYAIKSATPTIHNQRIYFGSTGGGVYALDEDTGSELWHNNVVSDSDFENKPYINDGTIILIPTTNNGPAAAVDISSGDTLWTQSQAAFDPPIFNGDEIYMYNQSDYLVGMGTNGDVIFSRQVENPGSLIGFDGSNVLAPSKNGYIEFVGTVGAVTDPSVSIGSQTVSYDGQLSSSSYQDTLSLSEGEYQADIGASSGAANVDLSWTETTETIDPSITISSAAGSQTVDYSGTLSDGSTADLSSEIDESLIEGNVSVSVAVSESVSSGPSGAVGVDYAHDAQETKQISYSGEEFSERYSFTHQWPHDRPSAEIVIPWASDRVVDVRSVQVNGQETTQYSAADGKLTVDLGSVQSGDQTNVTAVGSKVSVSGGSITVDDPTTQGEDLDSGISIDSLSSQTLEIDVSNSYHVTDRDRMIYVPDSSASWTAADPITRIEPGSQTVEIDPTSSSSFRLRSAGVGSSIPSGDAVLRMEDAAEPRVSVSPGETEGDTLKLSYHDTVSGDYYRVVDSEGNPLDTDRASSPAEFRISDNVGLFSIEQFTPEAIVSGISSGAAAVSSGDSLIPPWLALVATLTASVLGLAYASTRTEIGSSMIGRRVIIGGGLVLGYVGAELVTGEQLYRIAIDGIFDIVGSALGAGAGAGSGAISRLADIGFISLVLGIGLLVGLYAIDQRTGIDIPRAGWGIAAGLISVWVISQLGIGTGVSIGGQQSLSIVLAIGIVLGLLALDQRGILSIPLPLYAGTALLAGVYVLETLAPGSVLGPLQSGLDEVGPLIWLAIIGGALLLLWVWLRSNRPQIQILGRGGGNQ